MEILYIALGTMLVFLLYYRIIVPVQTHKKMIKLLSPLEELGYILTVEKNKPYQYALESQNSLFLIAVCKIPSNSTVTINSKDTWSLTWGGNPRNKGRAYHNQRYLTELTPFLRSEFKFDKPTEKLIILYPSTENILRYLNESELELVLPNAKPYGYRVLRASTLFENFKEIEGGLQ
ncbi:MAG: hypothetical protein PHY42_00760 [Bacilli bacterium]|nr:hypothetical protein [Bacilli bacterium]